MLAKMRNGGEACTAASRLYVANPLLDDFTDKFVKKMGELTLGNGMDEGSKLGPLVNPKQVQSVQELVDDAVEKGATVAVGGQAPGGPGNFYPATVLTNVPPNARILKEEVFGPVAPIVGFDTEQGLRRGQRHRVRSGGLHLDPVAGPGPAGGRVGSGRHGRRQPRGDLRIRPRRSAASRSPASAAGGFEGIDEYLDIKYIALTP